MLETQHFTTGHLCKSTVLHEIARWNTQLGVSPYLVLELVNLVNVPREAVHEDALRVHVCIHLCLNQLHHDILRNKITDLNM